MDENERLGEYDDTFLECRTLLHAWKVIGHYRQEGHVRRSLVCMRCGTSGTDIWRPQDARRIRRKYSEYPEGYRISGFGHIPAQVFRAQILNRVKIFETEEQMLEALFAQAPPRRRSRRREQ